MAWRRPPPAQFGLGNLLLLMALAAIFLLVGVRINIVVAILAIGVPATWRIALEVGIRVDDERRSNFILRTSAIVFAALFPFTTFAWIYIIVSVVIMIQELF